MRELFTRQTSRGLYELAGGTLDTFRDGNPKNKGIARGIKKN